MPAARSAVDLIPPNEDDRLAAVARYDILDTPRDGSFDRITALAARICDAPISTITIVDRDRIWFKSRHGVEADQIGRDPGLCASAILQSGPWIVSDAGVDPRTLENPLVRGELGLRFYLGVPLATADGFNLGTLNVIDRVPRELDEPTVESIKDLAAVVMDELELRLAARRLERALEEERSDFLIRAAHELRTPVSAVYGAVKSLTSGSAPLNDSAQTTLISMIEEQSERLVSLVKNIMLGAELEGGPIRLVRESFDPVWAAQTIVERSQRDLPAELELELDAPASAPEITSDSSKVRQILDNLIENAVKYSPDGGTIRVGVEVEGDVVRYTVRDEGEGVPVREHERIFEKFQRATETGEGAGLGLYVSRELARQLGGTLRLDAGEGRGSSFVFELPTA